MQPRAGIDDSGLTGNPSGTKRVRYPYHAARPIIANRSVRIADEELEALLGGHVVECAVRQLGFELRELAGHTEALPASLPNGTGLTSASEATYPGYVQVTVDLTGVQIGDVIVGKGEAGVAPNFLLHPEEESADRRPWQLQIDGAEARLLGTGKYAVIDLAREPGRVGVSQGAIVVDEVRFRADPATVQAIADLLAEATLPRDEPARPGGPPALRGTVARGWLRSPWAWGVGIAAAVAVAAGGIGLLWRKGAGGSRVRGRVASTSVATDGGEVDVAAQADKPGSQPKAQPMAPAPATKLLLDRPAGDVCRFQCPNVHCVAFSPDGRLIAAGAAHVDKDLKAVDCDIRLWNVRTRKLARRLTGHTSRVRGLRFTPDGRWLLSCGEKSLRLWDVDSGKELRRKDAAGNQNMSCIDVSADGRRALYASEILTTEDQGPYLRPKLTLSSLVCMWDIHSGSALRTFSSHMEVISEVAFSPDGRVILSASDHASLRFWDAETGKQLRCLYPPMKPLRPVLAAAFSPDGRFALSGGDDRRVWLWDVAKGAVVRSFTGHTGPVTSVAFSPDGGRVLSSSADKTIRLWGTRSGKELLRFEGHATAGYRRGNFSTPFAKFGVTWYSAVGDVMFSPDGRYALSSSAAEGTVRLWRLPHQPGR